MSDIKVSNILWSTLSDTEKLIVTSHLRDCGVLKAEQRVIGDVNSSPSFLLQQEASGTPRAKLTDWICKSVCQATGAEENCVHTSNNLGECLSAIRTYREARDPKNSQASQISLAFKN